MPDRELKLNSISRSSKQSPRLVLEEHGHCEVPAGCGGVVLRWRGHDDPIPVKLSPQCASNAFTSVKSWLPGAG